MPTIIQAFAGIALFFFFMIFWSFFIRITSIMWYKSKYEEEAKRFANIADKIKNTASHL